MSMYRANAVVLGCGETCSTLVTVQNYVILSGWDKVVLLSNDNGEVMTTINLPCQPVEPPKIVDFDGDSLNDVIVTCRQA